VAVARGLVLEVEVDLYAAGAQGPAPPIGDSLLWTDAQMGAIAIQCFWLLYTVHVRIQAQNNTVSSPRLNTVTVTKHQNKPHTTHPLILHTQFDRLGLSRQSRYPIE
jgi:hypothetical protein